MVSHLQANSEIRLKLKPTSGFQWKAYSAANIHYIQFIKLRVSPFMALIHYNKKPCMIIAAISNDAVSIFSES